MLDEKTLKLEIRLAAIEMLLTKVLAVQMMDASDAEFDSLIKNWADGLNGMVLPKVDAAVSDAVSAEYRDQVLRLFAAVGKMRQTTGI